MAKTDIAEAKKQLHQLIDNVDDAEVLSLYIELLSGYAEQNTFEPTADEVKTVKEGLASIKENGTITHNEAVAQLRGKYPNITL